MLPWNTVDVWFAWRPVRLSVNGTVDNKPDPDGAFFVDPPRGKRWAWWRDVARYRGLYIGTVYMDLQA